MQLKITKELKAKVWSVVNVLNPIQLFKPFILSDIRKVIDINNDSGIVALKITIYKIMKGD